MTRLLNWLLLLLIVALAGLAAAAFTVKNQSLVAVDFYVAQPSLPLALWLAVAMLIGVVLTWVALSMKLFRMRFETRRLNKKLDLADREISNLRALPGKDVS